MSYLSSKALSRRTVLRGLGASLALPFLDAMVPALSVRALAATRPAHRFQTFYVPNGMAMQFWTPKGEGKNFTLSPILEPLAAYKDQIIVLSGLKSNWNYIHAGASGSFLTGTTRGGRNEVEIIADVSMDQLLARHFANETQVASLEMSMDVPANAGACTGNLSCAYTHTLSWRSPTQPLPMEWNPRAVFERLFGDSGSTNRAARDARLRQHKSILDSVSDKLAGLKRDLGPRDQVKVDEYSQSTVPSIYAVGDVSGAHLNPAVTCGFWFARRVRAATVLPYLVSQLFGAFVASALMKLLFNHATLGATHPAGPVMQSFVLELVLENMAHHHLPWPP